MAEFCGCRLGRFGLQIRISSTLKALGPAVGQRQLWNRALSRRSEVEKKNKGLASGTDKMMKYDPEVLV